MVSYLLTQWSPAILTLKWECRGRRGRREGGRCRAPVLPEGGGAAAAVSREAPFAAGPSWRRSTVVLPPVGGWVSPHRGSARGVQGGRGGGGGRARPSFAVGSGVHFSFSPAPPGPGGEVKGAAPGYTRLGAHLVFAVMTAPPWVGHRGGRRHEWEVNGRSWGARVGRRGVSLPRVFKAPPRGGAGACVALLGSRAARRGTRRS